MPQLFIIPTLSCNAKCNYCYSNKVEGNIMGDEVLFKALKMYSKLDLEFYDIIFHGGEPLLAGFQFFEKAFKRIEGIFNKKVQIGIQSNLLNLTVDICKLFSKYKVNVGTSLDGPQKINDNQRGEGYYKNNLKGQSLLKKYGIKSNCIATISKQSINKLDEISGFFINNKIGYSIHATIKPYEKDSSASHCNSDDYKAIFTYFFELYKQQKFEHIPLIKTAKNNLFNNKGSLCTFTNCLGSFYSIIPNGDVYTCTRFIGIEKYKIGNINNLDSFDQIKNSDGWLKLANWQENIKGYCGKCDFLDNCKGGCMYAALSNNLDHDPLCQAYYEMFSKVLDYELEQLFQEKCGKKKLVS